MSRVNPVYVPREWMLVDAYKAASQKDFSKVPLALFLSPPVSCEGLLLLCYLCVCVATCLRVCGPEA